MARFVALALVVPILALAEAPDADTHPVEPEWDRSAHHDPGQWSLDEHELAPADRTRRTPPNWAGDPDPIRPDPWIDAEAARGDRFVQPFLVSAVRPEFALRIAHLAGSSDRAGGELDQLALVSFGWVEALAPLLTVRDGAAASADDWRLNLKLPLLARETQALTLVAGFLLPVQGRLTDRGGFNTWLGYAFGGPVLAAQARVGVGVDRFLGDIRSAPRSLVLYDATLGVRLAPWCQLIAQVDGTSGVGSPGSALRIMPGARLFPTGRQDLTLGAAFLGWFEKPSGDWQTRRLGLTVDVGWLFL